MSQITKIKIFNGKKYYLLTSPRGVEKIYAQLVARETREMNYRARVVKDRDKYFVYSR